MGFRYKIMQFMRGRYGVDRLFYVLFVIASVLAISNCFMRLVWIQIVVDIIVIYALFRVLSRNISARRKENQFFVSAKNLLSKKINTHKQRRADYTHVYKKCPRCHAVLRLPRRKGRHTTVCPKCQKEFKVYVFKA